MTGRGITRYMWKASKKDPILHRNFGLPILQIMWKRQPSLWQFFHLLQHFSFSHENEMVEGNRQTNRHRIYKKRCTKR